MPQKKLDMRQQVLSFTEANDEQPQKSYQAGRPDWETDYQNWFKTAAKTTKEMRAKNGHRPS